ncbi:MAG TPA: PQQ-binding-like beta-propeller repeat protein, partial [Chitinophagales bacterium]
MKKLIFKLTLALSIYGAFSTNGFSQGWAKKYAQDQSFFMPMMAHQQPDQSYVIIGNNLITQQALYQPISATGQPLSPIAYDSVAALGYSVATGDGGFGVLCQGTLDAGDAPGSANIRLLRLDNAGQKLWMKRVANYPTNFGSGNMGIDTTNDGGFIVTYRHDTATTTVIRTDNAGNVVWQNDYNQPVGNYITSIVSTNDNGFVVTLQSGTPHIFKLDGSGTVLWQYNGSGGNTTLAKDGNLLLTDNISGHSYIKKIDQNGNDLWTQSYPLLPDSAALYYIVERDSNKYAFTTAAYTTYDSLAQIWHRDYWLGELDSSGNILFTTQLPTSNFGFNANVIGGGTPRTFIATADNGYFITGNSSTTGSYGGYAWDIKTDSNGRAYPSTISGYVFNDANNSCLRDSSEQALITNLTISNATDTFLVAASDSGFFSLGVNEGTYNISLESISPYW